MERQDSLFPSGFAAYLWRWSGKWHAGLVPHSPDVQADSGRRWGGLWLQHCWGSKRTREASYGRSVHIRTSEASEGTYHFLSSPSSLGKQINSFGRYDHRRGLRVWECSEVWRLVSHAHVLHNPRNTFNATMCWDYTSINILNKFRSVPVWTGSHKEGKLWKGYLNVSEPCRQIGIQQHARAEEGERLHAELPEEALVHGCGGDTERQWIANDGVSPLTPASIV